MQPALTHLITSCRSLLPMRPELPLNYHWRSQLHPRDHEPCSTPSRPGRRFRRLSSLKTLTLSATVLRCQTAQLPELRDGAACMPVGPTRCPGPRAHHSVEPELRQH